VELLWEVLAGQQLVQVVWELLVALPEQEEQVE
jgi:hypothetical protein